ncbi:hypothetical protein ACFVQ3_00520 [Oerskovia sp. NPDC057915]|uniref:hypothetical protein n=1 Tax=Oerskovia sp. NPDC057915 TaxID=3346280 RepID=UPI0036DAD2A1
MNDASQPWDRRTGETSPAFAAFRAYLLLGPSRSLAKVGQESGGTRSQLERWSSRWSWVVRTRRWDEEQARIEDTAWRERARTHGRRQADAAAQVLDRLVGAFDQIDWTELAPLDAVRALDLAAKVESRAFGVPDPARALHISAPDGGPVAVAFTDLTDEQRAERMDALVREVQRRREIHAEDAARSVEDRAAFPGDDAPAVALWTADGPQGAVL